MLDRNKWDMLVELARDAVDEAQSLESSYQEIKSDMERATDSAINALEELQKMASDAGLDVDFDTQRIDNIQGLQLAVEDAENTDLDVEPEDPEETRGDLEYHNDREEGRI